MGAYYRASSVADAQRTLRNADVYAEVIAGGQELTLDIRRGAVDPSLLVDISEIEELRRIDETDDAFHVGACVTYSDLESDERIEAELPFVTNAVADIAGPPVRNCGTLGGALCDADPVFDMPALLLALDASVRTRSEDGTRSIPLTEFYRGHRETALGPDELLTTIVLPKLPARSGGRYRSMTPRSGDSTVAGVAVRLDLDHAGVCRTARIGLTNAGVVPLRAIAAEALLEDERIDAGRIEAATERLRGGLDLPDDPLVSREYREAVFERLTARTIRDVLDAIAEDD